jgi:RNA polymerase sigma-B factor
LSGSATSSLLRDPRALRRYPTDRLWACREDEAARDELVRRYLPLASKLARRYDSPHEPFEDLLQVATLGLIGAVDRFDPSRGVAFAAFAIPTVLGELKRYFRTTGWALHVPRGAQELALRVQHAADELSDWHGRSPGVDELADYLQLSIADVIEGLDAAEAHFATSLQAPGGEVDQDSCELQEMIGAHDERYDLADARMTLVDEVRNLPFLERQALTLRIRDDLKQVEVAEHMDCSQMQVSRLLRSAAARLSEQLNPA